MSRNATTLATIALPLALLLASCSKSHDAQRYATQQRYVDTTSYTAPPAGPKPSTFNAFAPPRGTVVHRMASRIVPGRLNKVFCDTNALQLTAATANGIEPITSLEQAYHLSQPIVKIATCDAYVVDDMTNSLPYLVPKAAQLLKEIGYAFTDTIKARGGKQYRMKVTSALRTIYSVGQLRKRNRNATQQSCHLYGTTFDVSWIKFDCQDTSYVISLEDLKNILAEVIYEKRQQGRCYAIFEAKTGCFHVTVR